MAAKTTRHQLLAAFLSVCMILSLFNGIAAFAEPPEGVNETGLCEHHTEHTAECGYAEPAEGKPCAHIHDETCGYAEPGEGAPCAHTHDNACGYSEGTEEIPCDMGCADTDGDGQVNHAEDCAYTPVGGGSPCTHGHNDACGYAAPTEGQACRHLHDDVCGCKEAVEGSPCEFVCEICSADSDALLDSGLTVNGKPVRADYQWQDEDGLMSLNVTFRGDVAFAGELPQDPVLTLDVEINGDEDFETLSLFAEDDGYLPVMTLRLHLTMGEQELDISGVSAQAELTVAKKAMLIPQSVDLVKDGDLDEDEQLTTELVVVQGNVQDYEVLDSVPYEALELTAAVAMMADSAEDAGDGEGEEENYEFNLDLTAPDRGIMLLAAVSNFTYNPKFTIQHYFWFPQVQSTQSDDGTRQRNRIPFMNTNQGGLGLNGDVAAGVKVTSGNNNNPTGKGFLVVDVDTENDNHLTTHLELKQMFVDENTNYQENPQINFMSLLYNSESAFNSNYTLTQVWVYQPDCATNTDDNPDNIENYIIYDVPWADGSTTVHAPERIRFTNNPSNSHLTIGPTRGEDNTWETTAETIEAATELCSMQLDRSDADTSVTMRKVNAGSGAAEGYPYDYTILIQEGTVVRLVFEVTEGNYTAGANFFDYNITDGYIYDAASNDESHRHPTTDQVLNEQKTWYAYTNQQGINHPNNYTGTGAKYAFGNLNTGSGLGGEEWKGNTLNKYNSETYNGITFGLVQNIDAQGNITWANGVTGPDIFTTDTTKTTGKFAYNGSMTFFRQGGTYTLDAVSGEFGGAYNLRSLPVIYDKDGTVINSNEFWPMDKVMGNEALGHDLAFGIEETCSLFRRWRQRRIASGRCACLPQLLRRHELQRKLHSGSGLCGPSGILVLR